MKPLSQLRDMPIERSSSLKLDIPFLDRCLLTPQARSSGYPYQSYAHQQQNAPTLKNAKQKARQNEYGKEGKRNSLHASLQTDIAINKQRIRQSHK
jgi:hypothetical protein